MSDINDKKHYDIKMIIINGIVSLIVGIIVALFSFWLNKAYGFELNIN